MDASKAFKKSRTTIYEAIKNGTILENVVYDPNTKKVDYSDKSITENTRAAYPIEFIEYSKSIHLGTI